MRDHKAVDDQNLKAIDKASQLVATVDERETIKQEHDGRG